MVMERHAGRILNDSNAHIDQFQLRHAGYRGQIGAGPVAAVAGVCGACETLERPSSHRLRDEDAAVAEIPHPLVVGFLALREWSAKEVNLGR